MTPNSIKALITLRNKSQREIAAAIRKRGIECSAEELNQTIHGHRVNADIREALAAELGMPVGELFDQEFLAVVEHRERNESTAA